MNIAFEISPLLLASGTFGDKSGVYRYYFGMIKALGKYVKKHDKKSHIVLFSFNRDLLNFPHNKEVLNLLSNDVFHFISHVPESKKENLIYFQIFESLTKSFFKIVNKIIPVKILYFDFINNIRFKKYLKFLNSQFKKYKIKSIYHSETSFYPLKDYKNIITIYDLTPIVLSYFHRKETNDLTQRKLYFTRKHCQGIVCISKSTKNDLLKHFPDCINKKITVCYPGLDSIFITKIDPSLFEDIKILSENQTIDLKSKKYLLFYGTFEPRKNIINLVQSFIELKQENKIPKDFKLILLGGDGWGKIKKTITNFIKENYIIKEKNSIVLFDYLNDQYLMSLIKNAYAVVYPSYYEGFGLPVLESMALGTPVITSYGSSLSEVGESSVLYIDPYDYNDLKSKMELIIKDQALANTLSIKGSVQSKKFHWEKSSHQLYEFLQKM